MAYDAARERIVLFGGQAAAGPFGDTWEWDGQGWTQVEDTGPSARQAHAMTHDVDPSRILLFGGAEAGGTGTDDTWAWDGSAWTQVADTGPSPRAGAAMVLAGSTVLLFGGVDTVDEAIAAANHHIVGDTWQWDGSLWTQVQDIGPTGRWLHTVTFEPAASRTVLFGGLSEFAPPAGPIGSGLLGDTWGHIEEEVAVHVSPVGNDANTGKALSPMRTINVAVAAAAGTGRDSAEAPRAQRSARRRSRAAAAALEERPTARRASRATTSQAERPIRGVRQIDRRKPHAKPRNVMTSENARLDGGLSRLRSRWRPARSTSSQRRCARFS